MLKNVCDMMLHLVKDFAFYSTITVEEEENCKNESTRKFGLDNSIGFNQVCNYREIIQDLVNMFNIKGKIDNRDNKVFIQERFDTEPGTDIIDCDKETFTSLFFNLLCHFYKVTHSGTIAISVSDCGIGTVSKSGTPTRRLLFEIMVSGVVQSNTLGTFFKNDEFVKNLVCEDIYENIDEERSSSRDSKDSRKSITSREYSNQSNKDDNENTNNLLIRADNTKFTLNPNQIPQNFDNFLVENYHLQNLFDVNDIGERNNIIDEFNNNFHIYISHLYSKRLGYKLIFEGPERKKQFGTPDMKNSKNKNKSPTTSKNPFNNKIDSKICFYVNAPVKNNSYTFNIPVKNSNSVINTPNNPKINKSPLFNFGLSSLSPVKKAIRRNTIDSCIFKFNREKNIINTANNMNITSNISNNHNNTNTARLFSLLNTHRKSLDYSYQLKRNLMFSQLNHPFSNINSPNLLNTTSRRHSTRNNMGSPMYTQSMYSNYSEKTVSNNGELAFNYPYFMNISKNIQNMFMGANNINNNRQHPSSNTVYSNRSPISEKECFINNGSIIINLYQTGNSQSNKSSFVNVGSNISNQNSNIPNNNNSNLNVGQKGSSVLNSPTKKSNFIHQVNKTASKNNSSVTLGKMDGVSDVLENSSQQTYRILICDDECLIRKMLSRYFNIITKENPKMVFDVTHSENGFECLNLIYKNYSEGKFFDILIIDETMPFFKGSQITYLLKTAMGENSLKNIIIISFTAYDSPEKKEFIYSQGADYVITKPIKFDDFKTFLSEVVIKENFEESYNMSKL